MKSCKLLLAKYRFVNIVLFFLEFISELFDKNSLWIDWPIFELLSSFLDQRHYQEKLLVCLLMCFHDILRRKLNGLQFTTKEVLNNK